MNRLLQGLRIVEGSAFVAAPLGGMTLAQLGAEVIRFDPIGGGIDHHRWPVTADGVSLYWAGLNKSKRSIAIDLKRPEGRELAAALVTAPGDNAGLFLTNLPMVGPLAYPALQAQRPDLVAVSLQGNHDGTSEIDYTVNAASGFAFVTGQATPEAPVNHVLPAWDVITGIQSALALVAGERHRRLTGEGQLLTLALSDVAFALAATLGPLAEAQVNDVDRPSMGNDVYGTLGLDFGTADGRRIMIVAVTPRQWRALIAATGSAEALAEVERRLGVDFNKEGDRFTARAEIEGIVAPWCATRSLDDIRTLFEEHGVSWGPFQTFRQALTEDARVSPANPLFDWIDQPGIGRMLVPGSPISASASPRRPSSPAPVLGADTDAVLADVLGLTAHQIGDLRDRHVVAGPAV